MRNSIKRFMPPTLRSVCGLIAVIVLLAGAASIYLAEQLAKSNLQQRLEDYLFTSHHNLGEWVIGHHRTLERNAADQLLVSAVGKMTDATSCGETCRNERTAELTDLLAKHMAAWYGSARRAGLVLVDLEGKYVAASAGTQAARTVFFSQVVAAKSTPSNSESGFYLPRPLPTALTGKSESHPSGIVITSSVLSKNKSPIAMLALILDPAAEFSSVISLKEDRTGTDTSNQQVLADIYSFNRQGVLISIPSLSSRLTSSDLVDSENLILNMTIRNPGGDVTDGYKSTLHRDDQKLTRLAASAIRGEAGIDLQGYRNYLGITVIGTWLWDRHLQLGIAVELDKAEAFASTRVIQWTIFLGCLGVITGLLWIIYLSRISRKENEAQSSTIEDRHQTVIESLQAQLQTGGKLLQEHRAELEQEVEEKKRFYDLMRSAMGLHKTLMDTSTDGILIIRDGIRILDFNSRFARLWGIESEYVAGDPEQMQKTVFESIAHQLGDQLDELGIVQSWFPERREEMPDYLSLRNGRKLEVISIPLPDAIDGSLVADEDPGVPGKDRALIFHEVTDRVSTDSVALQKLMCIEILSRGVSHEFNNILSAVFGYVELAQRATKPGDDIGYDLGEILDATRRAQILVQGFLAFSRRTDREDETIKCTALLDKVLTLVEQVIPSNVSVHKHFPDDEHEVTVSTGKIFQALLVVLFDTLNSMPKGGELHISIAGDELGKVHLTFADKAETNSSARMVTGARQVGDEYRGLAVQTEALDKILGERVSLKIKSTAEGSSRVLTLPGAPADDNYLSEEALFEYPDKLISGGIVLFVAKDIQTINPIREAMEVAGYGVLAMDNGLDALEKFRQHPDAFSTIISEVAIAGLSGDVLAHMVLDQNPDTVIVLCLEPNSPVNTDAAGFHGVYRVIQSPISLPVVNDLFASLSLPSIHQVSILNP